MKVKYTTSSVLKKKIKEIESIMERDKYFSPEEAIKFGLIDKIVESRKS